MSGDAAKPLFPTHLGELLLVPLLLLSRREPSEEQFESTKKPPKTPKKQGTERSAVFGILQGWSRETVMMFGPFSDSLSSGREMEQEEGTD